MGTIKYLNFEWTTRTLPVSPFPFTSRELRQQIVDFIDGGLNSFTSVMIVSFRNNCRSLLVAALYLMEKYKWTLRKTLELLCHKKPDLVITLEIFHALQAVERDIKNGDDYFGVNTSSDADALTKSLVDPEEVREQDELAILNSMTNSLKPYAFAEKTLKDLIAEAKAAVNGEEVKETPKKEKPLPISSKSPSPKKVLNWNIDDSPGTASERVALQVDRFKGMNHYTNKKPAARRVR